MIEPRPLKPPRSPLASLPGWDIAERIIAEQHNKAVLSNIEAREQWWDTFPDHAADLANAGLADEMTAHSDQLAREGT